MKNLMRKELVLAMHPASVLFLLLSAMLLIPNYPYYVNSKACVTWMRAAFS